MLFSHKYVLKSIGSRDEHLTSGSSTVRAVRSSPCRHGHFSNSKYINYHTHIYQKRRLVACLITGLCYSCDKYAHSLATNHGAISNDLVTTIFNKAWDNNGNGALNSALYHQNIVLDIQSILKGAPNGRAGLQNKE